MKEKKKPKLNFKKIYIYIYIYSLHQTTPNTNLKVSARKEKKNSTFYRRTISTHYIESVSQKTKNIIIIICIYIRTISTHYTEQPKNTHLKVSVRTKKKRKKKEKKKGKKFLFYLKKEKTQLKNCMHLLLTIFCVRYN
jgi:hypothetical protein